MFYEQFVTFEYKSENQWYALCPFHPEKTPSFTVNDDTQEWYCHSCGLGGSEKEFVKYYFDVTTDVARFAYSYWQKNNKFPFPSEEQIENWHQTLRSLPEELEVLYSFGFNDKLIDDLKLGFDDMRITIPIKSRTGYYVNVRRYLPPHHRVEGSKNSKCINIRNLGSRRYYPYEAFDEDKIYIVEGEKDCIAARSQGFNAVTSTGGSAIPTDELTLFSGKDVVLMLDTDSVGKRNVKNYTIMLKNIAKSISIVELPCKDFVECYQQYGIVDVSQYMKTIEEFDNTGADAQDITLARSEFTEHLNTWVKLNNMSIVGVEPKIYTVPTRLKAYCNNSSCKKMCPLATYDPTKGQEVDVDVRQLLRFIDSPDTVQTTYVRDLYGCKKVECMPVDFTNIQKIIFQESASFVDGLDEATFESRYGVYMYSDFRLSATLKYDFETCRVTDPKSQHNYYVIRSAKNVSCQMPVVTTDTFYKYKDAASKCNTAKELIDCYYEEWKPALAIEGRPDLFGSLLLTYCSVTEIPWQNGIIKGWLDTMIVGDTRTGKSQMAQRFVKLTGMGGYINGENARSTGVIGGVQKFGDSWVVTWGAIPMNDRGLLIIDEASGLEIEDVKNLSSTRSSGAVTLNKIVKGEARARTRLVWISNPRSGRNLSDFYWKGYGAFQEYIPVVEDQARYDIVVTAAREDLDVLEGIDSEHTPDIDSWRNLFAIAWSITSDNIVFQPDFKTHMRDTAKSLNELYGGGPLVIGVSVHEKLLRLACAFAILCGSVENGKLMVSNRHLDFASEFLSDTLDKESFAYGDFIRESQRAQKRRAENITFVRGLLTLHPAMKVILSSSSFKGFQFQEILGIDKSESSKILSDLITRGLVRTSAGATYVPDKMLMDIAKQMEV